MHFDNENEYREKTLYQKVKEAEIWEEIEKAKAKKRMELTQFGKNTATVNWSEPQEKGETYNIVAKKVGISSGSTYRRARSAVKEIDKLRKQDSPKLESRLNILIYLLVKIYLIKTYWIFFYESFSFFR
ncbi:hypothetical protein [Clostridium sp. DJ247]|uniref:hypothetical protein n=1 Tax=Clostridium sp. DJ247 TaxID=2726188 RepID=UPI00162AD772|nr:hypothetical protein [Clostridium sp. DJ247]MBC2580832.1 hypothetical protein [Clostridium sp. DJ247]